MKKNTVWRLVIPLGMALLGLFAFLHSSPAINKGVNLSLPTDLDGKPRDSKPDIGSYEYWSYLFLPLVKR